MEEKEIKFEHVETDTKLDLLKHLTEVQSKIKNEISVDFTLAQFDDKTINSITEISVNAYLSYRMYNGILRNMITKGIETWNTKTNTWEKEEYDPIIIKQIEIQRDETFDSYMQRLYLTAVLYRNNKRNHLLNTIAQAISGVIQNNNEQENEDEEGITQLQKIKAKLKNKTKKEEEI